MATNNFYNHENGILVINMHDSYDDYKEYLKMELDHEFITQEEYGDRIENMDCYYDWANWESIINLQLELEKVEKTLGLIGKTSKDQVLGAIEVLKTYNDALAT